MCSGKFLSVPDYLVSCMFLILLQVRKIFCDILESIFSSFDLGFFVFQFYYSPIWSFHSVSDILDVLFRIFLDLIFSLTMVFISSIISYIACICWDGLSLTFLLKFLPIFYFKICSSLGILLIIFLFSGLDWFHSFSSILCVFIHLFKKFINSLLRTSITFIKTF